ncbi:MAG: hypothetical protein J6X44_11140 [Thermoguttaceae bacterium]|nr:hypothetical protein [Thermoguttaceae bacterium]
MNKTVSLVFLAGFFFGLFLTSFGAEPDKLILLHQDWKEKNAFNEELFDEKIQMMCEAATPDPHGNSDRAQKTQKKTFKEESSAKKSRMLLNQTAYVSFLSHEHIQAAINAFCKYESDDVVGEKEKSPSSFPQLLWEDVKFNSDSIPGYALTSTRERLFDDMYDVSFRIDPTQFANPSVITSTKEGNFSCRFMFSMKKEVFLMGMTSESCAPPIMVLSLYKIDDGPGDECYVAAGSKQFRGSPTTINDPLKDDVVLFFRDNVAVLINSVSSVGCMDLAYRIDDYLKERLERKRKQSQKACPTDEILTSP